MSRIRIGLLSLLAVLAFSAVAAASASADEFVICKKEGPGHKYETAKKCAEGVTPPTGEWERVPIAAGEKVPVEGTSKVSILEGEVLTVKVIIECQKDTFTGELEAEGKNKGKVTFTECAVINPETHKPVKHCSVHEPIEFSFLSKLLSPGDEFKPAVAGTPFVAITIEGSECVIKGTYNVEGTCTGEITENVFQMENEIVFKESSCEHTLTLYGKPAKFTSTEKVKLGSGGYWEAN